MKKIGIVGYGYWGPNLLRNFIATPDCDVLYCCDVQTTKLKEIRKKFSSVIVTSNYQDLLDDSELDGIVIATPTKLHHPLAKQALLSGKDVLIEKPMTLTSIEADELVSLAARLNKILMVDHTFLFHEAVRKIKSLIDSKEIGEILYIDSVRANLGLFQKDSNVIYDLAAHDFSIIQYLLGDSPIWLQAHGKSHFNNQEDVSYIYVEYPKNISAHFHVSWLSPLKIRQLIIVGTKKMIVYNDLDDAEKIKVYEKGVDMEKELSKNVSEIRINYRSGDVWMPNLKISEALSQLTKEFIAAMNDRKSPLSDGKFGSQIVKILEKSTESLRSGKKIDFKLK